MSGWDLGPRTLTERLGDEVEDGPRDYYGGIQDVGPSPGEDV